MVQPKLEAAIREPADQVRILDLRGPITRSTHEPLAAAYQEASSDGAEIVILNFVDVKVMDSYGVGVLIALLARAQQEKQRLMACGLDAQLQRAFEVTHLDEALEVYASEAEALESLGP
jgi:anti-anti-sigma factor